MDNHIAHNDIRQAAGFRSRRGEFDYEMAFEKFKKKTMQKHSRFSIRYLVIAASITALFAFFSYRFGQQSVEHCFSDITISVPAGSCIKTVLPDGTSVSLNSCSSITYSQGFGVKDRNIKMIGEGCFRVAHNEDIPFVVTGGSLEVEVLGTVFNYRDYPEDAEATVSLSEGKISLRSVLSSNDGINYLSPGQSLVLDKENGSVSINSNDVANSMLWIDGTLFFDELKLCDIARKLERAYDVRITIESSELGAMRIYGAFMTKEQRIDDVLDILSKTHHLHYRMSGNDYIIY